MAAIGKPKNAMQSGHVSLGDRRYCIDADQNGANAKTIPAQAEKGISGVQPAPSAVNDEPLRNKFRRAIVLQKVIPRKTI